MPETVVDEATAAENVEEEGGGRVVDGEGSREAIDGTAEDDDEGFLAAVDLALSEDDAMIVGFFPDEPSVTE